jgi:hypothetical protein
MLVEQLLVVGDERSAGFWRVRRAAAASDFAAGLALAAGSGFVRVCALAGCATPISATASARANTRIRL